jgi:hypothetical protein
MSTEKVMVIVRQLSPSTHPVAHAVIKEPGKEALDLTSEEYDNYLPEWFEEQAAKLIADFRSKFPEFETASFLRYILENDGTDKFLYAGYS